MLFEKVAEAYVSYVRRHYGRAKIVFDGYEDPMSIKANEHFRRSSKGSSQNITVKSETKSLMLKNACCQTTTTKAN